ncbi:periplasmic heavy metal sensor [Azospirillum halopraeferens]|uniref:periplasmic heavy metal sensor n=1 Tax=Azospirillum halopraeferens TaxID=34010 RepID=UPI00042A00B8|nr:periplasmic heavy metal sensor [Azospirillum halopraeferens]
MIRPTVRCRWPWYLLVASLGLNMFFGVVLAARAWHHRPPPSPEHRFEQFIERASGVLGPADAELLREAFATERASLAAIHANIEVLRLKLRESLTADTFDADALARTFDRTRTMELDLRRRVDARVVETLNRLSDEGRHRLADLGR